MGNFCHIRYKKYYVKCFSMRFDLVWDVSTIFFNNNIFLQNKKNDNKSFLPCFFLQNKKNTRYYIFYKVRKWQHPNHAREFPSQNSVGNQHM